VTDATTGRTVRRRAIAGTLLHATAAVTAMLWVYYQAPLDRPLDAVTGLLFVLGLSVFCAVMALQVRGIVRSREPRLRAVRAMAVGVPLLLVVYAATYVVVANAQTGAFTEPLDRTDGLYFTVTVFTTVGFGDISPVSELARVLVTTQMLVGLVTVGLVARLVFGAVQVAVARRGGDPSHEFSDLA
jgi:voltage-gated potassium channel